VTVIMMIYDNIRLLTITGPAGGTGGARELVTVVIMIYDNITNTDSYRAQMGGLQLAEVALGAQVGPMN
jgi:hypothetical protein